MLWGVRVELVGGPLDGLQTRPSRPASFLYISEQGRCWRKPGAGRHLYRASRRRGIVLTYVYAGHTWAQCGGCGAWGRTGYGDCTLCGHALVGEG